MYAHRNNLNIDLAFINRFLAAMPAYVSSRHALACKLVTFYPGNAAKNMDTHMATILLFDETSGTIKAVFLVTHAH